jgi:hypothetical protein
MQRLDDPFHLPSPSRAQGLLDVGDGCAKEGPR